MRYIITDDIFNECCNLVLLFTDTEYVRKKILQYYSNLSEEKQKSVSNQIKMYINQGIGFISETDQSVFTSSLNLFYALNNFSKAIYLLHFPNLTLSQSHGLTFEGDSLKRESRLSDINITVNKNGTFRNLLDITGDFIKENEKINLKNVLSIIPELAESFADCYNEEPNIFLYTKKGKDYEIMLHNVQACEELRKRDFSYALKNGCHIDMLEKPFLWFDGNYKDTNKLIYDDVFGNQYCCLGAKISDDNSLVLSKISSYYLCCYAFSMLVRYYPESWRYICDSADIAIVRKMVIHCRKDLMAEILNLLLDDRCYFSTKLELAPETMDLDTIYKKLKKRIREEEKAMGRNPLL